MRKCRRRRQPAPDAGAALRRQIVRKGCGEFLAGSVGAGFNVVRLLTRAPFSDDGSSTEGGDSEIPDEDGFNRGWPQDEEERSGGKRTEAWGAACCKVWARPGPGLAPRGTTVTSRRLRTARATAAAPTDARVPARVKTI